MAKEKKIIHGTSIENIQGYNSWLGCRRDFNERVTIPFSLLFDLFDKYDFTVEKIGNRWRAIGFEETIEGGLMGK
jgi:hypothetical protein